MASSRYTTRQALFGLIPLGVLSRFTTDNGQRVQLANGDGAATEFLTPFARVTTFQGFVNGVTSGITVTVTSRGAGTWPAVDGSSLTGADKATFTSGAPAALAVVEVVPDQNAVNLNVLDQLITDVSDDIDGYLAEHGPPFTAAETLRILRPKANVLCRYRCYSRRGLEANDPLIAEWKAVVRWLERTGSGDAALLGAGSIDPTEASTDTVADELIFAEEPVFEDPTNQQDERW